MVWVIAEFTDSTVAPASEAWILVKDGKIFCKWPRKDVEKKNRANAIPDDSKDWKLHECRLLMKGERFDSYDSARAAVVIAQEHSTMSSYIKSKSTKRARKRPAKFSTTESESDNEIERKKIKAMGESDLKHVMNAKKTYSYIKKTSTPLQNILNESSFNNDGENSNENRKNTLPSNAAENFVSQRSSSDSGGEDVVMRKKRDSSSDSDGEDVVLSEKRDSSSDSDGESLSSTKSNRSHNSNDQLFSRILSTIDGDNDECRPTDIREELKEMKKVLHDISEASNKNTAAIEELKEIGSASIVVFKDLSAEVFKCKEEIKKRNGLFTDLLHPDIEVPMLDPDHYEDLTEKLKDKRLIDNLVKYLATVHNESDEEEFVKASMKTLFKFDFFMKKVTWKIEPDRVYVKKSRVMQCWRESFKLKFGAKEPKKSDKEVNKFIHGVCARYKDASRKAKRIDYDF